MNSVQTISTGTSLGPPKGWNQDELICDSLWVNKTEYGGVPAVVSFWKPTEDELDWLKNGALIELSIIGYNMPPVAVNVVCHEREVFE